MPRGTSFAHAVESFGDLAPDDVSRLVAAAADVALVLDPDGTVQDLAFRDREFEGAFGNAADWRGRNLADTVTAESRPKLASMLDAAGHDRDTPRRHLNHATGEGNDIAVEYAAIRTGGAEGQIVAFGRDLRPIATLQQRLVEAQQTISRDYTALRQAQARYRLLFEGTPEPLLVLDAGTLRVSEANDAARALTAAGRRAATGRPATELFDPADRSAVTRFLANARGPVTPGAQPQTLRVRLAAGPEPGHGATLSATRLGEDDAILLMLRLGATTTLGSNLGTTLGPAADPAADPSELSHRLLTALDQAPDAFAFTGPDGKVIAVNAAFVGMAQLPSAAAARGASLDDWVGMAGVDLPVLLANLRQHGSVRLFRSTVRGVGGLATDVEISAVSVDGAGTPAYGFAIRDVGRRLDPAPDVARGVPRSVEQLTELIGRVSLKDLVRDATDVIERLCIEAALELTGDNRASAAEMLGLSRQSLYVKMRRYGLGDLDEPGDDS